MKKTQRIVGFDLTNLITTGFGYVLLIIIKFSNELKLGYTKYSEEKS